jgi:hypothetical protein
MAPWVSAAFASPAAIIWLLAVIALSLGVLRVFASATFTAIGLRWMLAGYIAAAAAMTLLGVIVERLDGVNWLEVSLAMTFASWLALAVVIAPGAFIAFRFTGRWWSAIASVSLVVPILIFLLDLWDVGTPAVERLIAYPIREMENVAGLVFFFALSGFSFAVGARLKSK